jgi:hypothetical protein
MEDNGVGEDIIWHLKVNKGKAPDPTHLRETLLPKIVDHCSVPLPYSEPLIIPVGIVTSTTSWGDCG